MFKEMAKSHEHSRFKGGKVDLVFAALDDDANNVLSCDEFQGVVDVRQLKFIEEMEYSSPVRTIYARFLWD